MTCPHCGATAREHERFCPKCSRLIASPLLKMRQELDAARAAMQRDRPAPLAKTGALQGHSTSGFQFQAPLPAAGAPVSESPSRTRKNEARKAEIRARLAAARGTGSTPPPMPREVHTRASHESVPDDTLERARREQGAGATDALARARQGRPTSPPSAAQPSAPPKRQRGNRPAAGQSQPQVDRADAGAKRRFTPALFVFVLFNLATLASLYAGVRALEAMPDGSLGRNSAEAVRVAAYVLGGVVALATLGLWTLRPFGRALQRLTTVPWLAVFPFGTLYAFVAIIYLGSRGARLLFSDRSGGELTSSEQAMLTRTRRYAPLMALLLFVLGGMAWGTVVGAAATFDPALRAPGTVSEVVRTTFGGAPAETTDPREAMLDDLEAFATGQSAYAHANGGFYDRTECLVANTCLPGQPLAVATLDARFLAPIRHGYEFRLRLGPPPATRGEEVSATSATGFTYLALPTSDSPDTWGYCIERYLTICRFVPSAPITSPPGECPAECEFVR